MACLGLTNLRYMATHSYRGKKIAADFPTVVMNFKIHFIYTRVHVFTMKFNKIKNSRSVNGMIITQVLN